MVVDIPGVVLVVVSVVSLMRILGVVRMLMGGLIVAW
jgi:hypothetical protein